MAINELCKVRFDGSHYLASPYVNDSDFTVEEIVELDKEKLGLKENEKKSSLFYNEYARLNYGIPVTGPRTKYKFLTFIGDLIKERLDIYYEELKRKDISYKDFHFLLWAKGVNDPVLKERLLVDEDDMTFYKETKKFLDRKRANNLNRELRFKRKAYNNDWNYFCTFTYNDVLCDEETFVKRLKTKLQNLHSKKGWLYMGAFERGKKTNRLHFHAIVYVPEGTMPGKLRNEKSWDNDNHKIIDVVVNESFEKKIGRNDFKEINKFDNTFDRAIEYVIKYISKSNDKIVYSRGLKDEYIGYAPFDDHLICSYGKTSSYYVMDERFINKFVYLSKNCLN